MGASSTYASTTKVDLAGVVLYGVWPNTELTPWSVHLGALQRDVSPVTAHYGQCIWADLSETVCLVAFSTEPYVILDDFVFFLCAHHSDLYAERPLLRFCQDGSHGC